MKLKIVRKLHDGRVLLGSPRGDQYWILDQEGHKKQLTLQEAVLLMSEPAAQDTRVTRRRRSKVTKAEGSDLIKVDPQTRSESCHGLDRQEIEDAVWCSLTRDPVTKGKFKEVKRDLTEEIRARADEIQEALANFSGSERELQFKVSFYRGMARLWRDHQKRPLDKI